MTSAAEPPAPARTPTLNMEPPRAHWGFGASAGITGHRLSSLQPGRNPGISQQTAHVCYQFPLTFLCRTRSLYLQGRGMSLQISSQLQELPPAPGQTTPQQESTLHPLPALCPWHQTAGNPGSMSHTGTHHCHPYLQVLGKSIFVVCNMNFLLPRHSNVPVLWQGAGVGVVTVAVLIQKGFWPRRGLEEPRAEKSSACCRGCEPLPMARTKHKSSQDIESPGGGSSVSLLVLGRVGSQGAEGCTTQHP